MSDIAEDYAVNDVEVEIVVVLGSSTLRLKQILQLGRGAVVELESGPNDQVEVYANEILIAKGEVVITGGDVLGVAVTEVLKSVYTSG
jgi:flagellar motor switch protein FliN/FliY